MIYVFVVVVVLQLPQLLVAVLIRNRNLRVKKGDALFSFSTAEWVGTVQTKWEKKVSVTYEDWKIED